MLWVGRVRHGLPRKERYSGRSAYGQTNKLKTDRASLPSPGDIQDFSGQIGRKPIISPQLRLFYNAKLDP
jgi:hypothetical protein